MHLTGTGRQISLSDQQKFQVLYGLTLRLPSMEKGVGLNPHWSLLAQDILISVITETLQGGRWHSVSHSPTILAGAKLSLLSSLSDPAHLLHEAFAPELPPAPPVLLLDLCLPWAGLYPDPAWIAQGPLLSPFLSPVPGSLDCSHTLESINHIPQLVLSANLVRASFLPSSRSMKKTLNTLDDAADSTELVTNL